MMNNARARPEFRLSPPTYRVIQRVCQTPDDVERMEGDIRRRDKYDLAHVTQSGETFTLFFRLKEEWRNPREHLSGLSGEGKTHEQG